MIYINGYNACCALGTDIADIMAHLTTGQSPGMRLTPGFLSSGQSVFLGHAVFADKTKDADAAFFATHPEHNSRNNRLTLHTMQPILPLYRQLCQQHQIKPERIALVMGTSTSGGAEIDEAVSVLKSGRKAAPGFRFEQQEPGNISAFMQDYLGLASSPLCYTISTACSSTMRAIITAVKMLKTGLCDLVIAGGTDTLNRAVVNGFNALSLVSTSGICCPFGAQRDGITIGEASGLMLLSRFSDHSQVAVAGTGESSDAHHMSAPHPDGAGARRAINAALKQAQVKPADIGYISLHGTGTRLNDEVEAGVIAALFGPNTPCSSIKYLTGHTLGACGVLETIILSELLRDYAAATAAAASDTRYHLIKQDFKEQGVDPELPPLHFCEGSETLSTPYVLNNAFAFGGNNAALVLKAI